MVHNLHPVAHAIVEVCVQEAEKYFESEKGNFRAQHYDWQNLFVGACAVMWQATGEARRVTFIPSVLCVVPVCWLVRAASVMLCFVVGCVLFHLAAVLFLLFLGPCG
jgi:hypothetical protein